MNRHLSCAVLIVAFLVAVPVHAQTNAKSISDSGNRYLDICAALEKPPAQWNEMDFLNSGLCQGFMLGFRDGIGLSIAMLKHNDSSLSYLKGSIEDLAVCTPDNVEVGQVVRIVLKYIRDHPEQAHLPSAQLIVLAEFNVYPCTVTPTPAPKPKQ
jgi:Rap1a immunity proteins